MNSYLAVEFEFLFDVLQALRIVKDRGISLRVVIKVRSNGYREQYEQFCREYFPGLVDDIADKVPIKDILEQTDFFISIYSQTLFEASCLGIPCVYYKKDDEIKDPPFDGHSELVTVFDVDGLVKAFFDFQAGNKRFGAFLDKSVMERYVGPLDGKNLERNLTFVHELLAKDGGVVV
jgi:CDP-glycerol glycerophosphotransferase (TagB/SpsB family)